MPRIAEETLQQILASTDIVDLVGRSVKLRRRGTNWIGLCPFHQEKSPSFNVNQTRGTYHCFGCSAGGNAFRFVMEHEGLTFVEAARRLGDAAGIRMEDEVWNENAEREAKVRKALMKVHTDIAEWYHTLLMKGEIAVAARDYLKSRDINAQTAKNWQLGYAPPHGDILREWALEKKYTENLLVAAGILKRADEDSGRAGETYPFFRHRLMFPIRNDQGEVIAFSGRHIEREQSGGKYVNSPETAIFTKSKVFFGLDKSKRAIIKADRAIVCEGQLDLITAFEHGVENVVAPLGTAFTEIHARTLRRHAEEVVLCFDSDAAGYKAAERAFTILAPTGLIVKVAPLPEGEDPDSLIRTQGTEAFIARIDAAKDFFDHVIEFAAAHRNLNDTREKTKFADDTAAMIALVDNSIARDAAIQRVSVRLGIPESDFRRQVARAARNAQAQAKTNTGTRTELPLPPQDKTALLLTRLVLADAEILRKLRASGRDAILADVTGTELLALVWKSQSDLSDPARLAAFLSTLGRDEEHALTRLIAQPSPKGGATEAEHALDALDVRRLENLLQRAQTELKQPGLSPSQISGFTSRMLTLRKEYLDRRARLQDSPSPPTAA